MITAENYREGTNAKGKWEMLSIVVVDIGQQPRCINSFEVTLPKGDLDMRTKLTDTTQEIDITGIEESDGRLRINGTIARTMPKKPPGQPQG